MRSFIVLAVLLVASGCGGNPEIDPVPTRLRGPTYVDLSVGGEDVLEVGVEGSFGGLIEDATVDYFISCEGNPDGCPATLTLQRAQPLGLGVRGVRPGVMRIVFRHGHYECTDPPMCYGRAWIDAVDPLQTTIAVRE